MDPGLYKFYIKVGLASGKENTCKEKKGFTSEAYAKKVMAESSKTYGATMVYYPCIWCGYWHIGHKIPFEKMLELEKKGDAYLKAHKLKIKDESDMNRIRKDISLV